MIACGLRSMSVVALAMHGANLQALHQALSEGNPYRQELHEELLEVYYELRRREQRGAAPTRARGGWMSSIGRIVHYVPQPGDIGPYRGRSEGEVLPERPAIVVAVHSGNCVNLQVFTDGLNDGHPEERPLLRKTSVLYSASREPGTWHWPERESAESPSPPDLVGAFVTGPALAADCGGLGSPIPREEVEPA